MPNPKNPIARLGLATLSWLRKELAMSRSSLLKQSISPMPTRASTPSVWRMTMVLAGLAFGVRSDDKWKCSQ